MKGQQRLSFKALLPSPFTIAVLLTVITFILAYFIPEQKEDVNRLYSLLTYWENGIRNPPLLVFAFQMMLMLVLGHALALSAPVAKAIGILTRFGTSTSCAAWVITFSTMTVGFFNWGLGLVFGAILARKTAEWASSQGIKLNYPLIGAAGYSGMMVWHGGLSGSAPLKVAEPGHFLEEITRVIPVTETLFSSLNIFTSLLLFIILPLILFFAGKRFPGKSSPSLPVFQFSEKDTQPVTGMEKLDSVKGLGLISGLIILTYLIIKTVSSSAALSLINPDFINLILLGCCLLLHRNIKEFLLSVEHGMPGAAGILIQFPLYFGIMGIMSESGLIQIVSEGFVAISNENSFPIFTFISAALVNIFVPSGGGQWAVQGPVIVEAATTLGVPVSKAVMALAYGDQLTNMLQPFWALPLLGITGLKAKEILPYSLLLMAGGIFIFLISLLLF